MNFFWKKQDALVAEPLPATDLLSQSQKTTTPVPEVLSTEPASMVNPAETFAPSPVLESSAPAPEASSWSTAPEVKSPEAGIARLVKRLEVLKKAAAPVIKSMQEAA